MKEIGMITVWGDSILGGIVPDPEGGKYIRLNDRCCVAGVEKELGLPIKNYSRFGMTSEKGLGLMEKNIEEVPGESAALIGFGGNDVDYRWEEIALDPGGKHLPKVPPEMFEHNIESMVGLLKIRGIVPLIATLPPINSKRYFEKFSRSIPNRENILKWLGDIENIYRSHAFYNDIIRKTAARLNCRLIDVRDAFIRHKDYLRFISEDGIHPNEEGHELMKREYLSYAKSNMPVLHAF
jgi:lysophospholipase L1-like esterase